MEQTANLELPYIMPSQAQKHVTHNEAVRSLDALVQLAVLDRDLPDPPASPNDGERYLVAPGGTDAWTGRDGQIAAWQDGAWAYFAPKAGWLAWVADEERLIAFDGAGWTDAAVHSVNPAPLVGVNATADATNRLAIKSPASLFDQEAGDHRVKINKAAAADTASLVFQSGYSGRAEFGLAGDDDWHVKVSADGLAWTEALKVDRSSGRVTLPASLPLGDSDQVVAARHVREKLTANRAYYVRTDGSDSNDGLTDSSGGAFLTIQKAIDVVAALDLSIYDVTIQVADGTYTAGAVVGGSWVGKGTVTLRGNVTTPSNCVISMAGGTACIFVQNNGVLNVGGFKLVNSSGSGLYALNGGYIGISGALDFGACSVFHMGCGIYAKINCTVSYSVTGAANQHANAVQGGYIYVAVNTVTLTGTPAFGNFIAASRMGLVEFISNTFSGSATGARYLASAGGGVNSNGGGATYLPGNASGTATSPGWYA